MEKVRVLEIKQSVFASNDAQADLLRAELKEKGIYLLNLMSSPGSGKTTTLKSVIAALNRDLRISRTRQRISRTPPWTSSSRVLPCGWAGRASSQSASGWR